MAMNTSQFWYIEQFENVFFIFLHFELVIILGPLLCRDIGVHPNYTATNYVWGKIYSYVVLMNLN